MKKKLTQRLLGVEMIVLDVDGVLTDGRIYKTDSGGEMLAFHVRDGMGIVKLREAGIGVVLLSSRLSGAMIARSRELGVTKVLLGESDKSEAIENIARDENKKLGAIAYMGDDLVDIGAMKKVGLAIAPADAVEEVKEVAHLVLEKPGGMGAVREAAEIILKSQNKWKV